MAGPVRAEGAPATADHGGWPIRELGDRQRVGALDFTITGCRPRRHVWRSALGGDGSWAWDGGGSTSARSISWAGAPRAGTHPPQGAEVRASPRTPRGCRHHRCVRCVVEAMTRWYARPSRSGPRPPYTSWPRVREQVATPRDHARQSRASPAGLRPIGSAVAGAACRSCTSSSA